MIIELILKAIGLYDGFVNYLDARKLAEEQARQQARDKAIDDATKATTPDEAWNAQTGIVDSEP